MLTGIVHKLSRKDCRHATAWTDEGLARLARTTAKVDFPALANQFEAQSNVAFCGPTTAAIVLNAVRSASRDLPRDQSRLRPEDLRYIPSGFDLSVPRFMQDDVFWRAARARSKNSQPLSASSEYAESRRGSSPSIRGGGDLTRSVEPTATDSLVSTARVKH